MSAPGNQDAVAEAVEKMAEVVDYAFGFGGPEHIRQARRERARQVAEEALEASALLDEVKRLRAQLEQARLMAHSPGRDPANVLRDVRGALGLDRTTPDPAGGV